MQTKHPQYFHQMQRIRSTNLSITRSIMPFRSTSFGFSLRAPITVSHNSASLPLNVNQPDGTNAPLIYAAVSAKCFNGGHASRARGCVAHATGDPIPETHDLDLYRRLFEGSLRSRWMAQATVTAPDRHHPGQDGQILLGLP